MWSCRRICVQSFTEAKKKKKKAEKQEISLLQLAAFVGRFESMHGLLPLAQPAFKGRLREGWSISRMKGSESLSIHSMLDLKSKNYEQYFKSVCWKHSASSLKQNSQHHRLFQICSLYKCLALQALQLKWHAGITSRAPAALFSNSFQYSCLLSST